MQRTIMVRPDAQFELGNGEVIEVVSREGMLQALADLEALLNVAGGGATIITERVSTDVPGERMTAAAMIRWQDRTDNPREQPEQSAPIVPRAPEPAAYLDDQRIALTPEDLQAVIAARAAREVPEPPTLTPEQAMAALDGVPQAPPVIHPDVPSDPDAEDVSAIPESVR